MASPRRFALPALLVALALWATTLSAPAAPPTSAAATTATSAATSAAAPDETRPLRVRITRLTPSSLSRKGVIEVSGTVTNLSRETWHTINLYSFLGDDQPPMRNARQLAAAMDTPLDAYVGERIVSAGSPGHLDSLEAGATGTFNLTVPMSAFNLTGPGVYWFGVQAIGTSDSTGRDETDDGRARTLLPFVPKWIDEPLTTALVIPVTRAIAFAADGAVEDPEKWLRTLTSGGRLHELLEFGSSSTLTPVTWLLDPAVIDVVGQLAEGNPPRELSQPVEESPTPTDDGTGEGEEPEEPVDTPLTRAATAWLERLAEVTDGSEVLALPYGNPDLTAVSRYHRPLLSVAAGSTSRTLTDLGITARPVVASPNGYLDPELLPSIIEDVAAGAAEHDAGDPVVLLSDRMVRVARGATSAATHLAGQRLLVSAHAVGEGSPTPGARSAVGLRQRFLAEAAIRRIRRSGRPLVAVLPTDWSLTDGTEFFAGLDDVDWLAPTTAGDVFDNVPADALAPEDLEYPDKQRRRELDLPTIEAGRNLINSGELLQGVLVGNNELAGAITRQALSGVAYAVRGHQNAARFRMGATRTLLRDRIDGIRIRAARGVTLSSESGTFLVSLTNTLDRPVLVGVHATSDDGITFTEPDPVELGPGARTNVSIEASTHTNRVHNVTLEVVDRNGQAIGPTTELPIRSAQVSNVIWVIMGSGVGLLFTAILIRLFRRWRRSRAGRNSRHTRSEATA